LARAIVRTYRISKTFNAPLRFVYSWCTDYREDDMKMIGSRKRRHILERTRKMIIWRVEGKEVKSEFDPIRAVWLRPPDSWHLECCGDETEVGEYKLVPLGKEKARLDMTFRTTYYDQRKVVSTKSYLRDARAHWDGYGRNLERDYRRSVAPAKSRR
jgi:hypothetical protein